MEKKDFCVYLSTNDYISLWYIIREERYALLLNVSKRRLNAKEKRLP